MVTFNLSYNQMGGLNFNVCQTRNHKILFPNVQSIYGLKECRSVPNSSLFQSRAEGTTFDCRSSPVSGATQCCSTTKSLVPEEITPLTRSGRIES